VKSACVDQLTPAENQSRGLRPAQSFSTAEDHEIGALLREVPEVLDRRELGRGVDDDRDMGFMSDRNDGLKGECAVRSRWISGEVEHRCGASVDRRTKL
jgi:hypothetical protein